MSSVLTSIPMFPLYYIMGLTMIPLAFVSQVYGLYSIVAITLLSNPIMSKQLAVTGFGWYAYFTLVDVAVGAYLISFDSDLVRLAGGISILTGVLTISCSRWPNWIHHNYDVLTGMTNAAFLVFLFAAAFMEAPFGLR